jgi:hypothetical protein
MGTEAQPARTVLQLATAYWASRCLHIIAELGIADRLGDEPQTAEALARAVDLKPRPLHRILRSLANHGIFAHDGERFAHNEASRMLRTDAPGSMRQLARMMGLKVHWDAYRDVDIAVSTGEASIGKGTDGGLFSHLRAHPDERRVFDEAMAGKSALTIGSVVDNYDFGGFSTIGDIGGGLGHLLYAVLDQATNARGLLFDLPEVIARARGRAHPRVSYVGANFFQDPIPACDCYMMMTVLHDWSDAESVAILENVKARAPRAAKLLLIEGVVHPQARDDFILDLDVEMLVMTTGHERTEAEWRAVLTRGGFRLVRIINVGPLGSIVEAELA